MRRVRRLCVLLSVLAPVAGLLLVAPPAEATTLRVGPGRALETPSEAAAVARDGDVVEIDAGTYVGDVATWTQDDLTLRGVGGEAHLKADGRSAQGKAIWVIAGDRTRVENIELSGATVPDGNGAGIRQEGAGLTVVKCSFHHNQNGILAGVNQRSTIKILRSRFQSNGAGDGQTHNLYIGDVRRLVVKGSVFAGARQGHEIKSRAETTRIVANLIMDRGSTASYSLDLPNGGDTLIAGNVIEQGPRSPNRTLVSYGAEGFTHDSRRLWVVNNTFINRQTSGTVLAPAAGTRGHVWNNLLSGPGTAWGAEGTDRRSNLRTTRGFRDPDAHDFRLRKSSRAIDRGVQPPKPHRAVLEYRDPRRTAPRPKVGRLDVGAYEHVG